MGSDSLAGCCYLILGDGGEGGGVLFCAVGDTAYCELHSFFWNGPLVVVWGGGTRLGGG